MDECCICGDSHDTSNCTLVTITNHILDSDIPSRAKLTIPDTLRLQILTDGSYSIVAKSVIEKGTKLGPFIAAKSKINDSSITFPLKVDLLDENGNSEQYLNFNDENQCNWLIFINPAEKLEEQNIICYQDAGDIYYVTIKKITVGETLRVWYSPFYAKKMNKPLLQPDFMVDNIEMNSLVKLQQKIIERKFWTCKFCSHVEDNVVIFAKHIQLHYSNELKRFCEICKKGFKTKKRLVNHLNLVHNPNQQQIASKPEKNPKRTEIFMTKDIALGGPLLNDINDFFNDSSDLPQFDSFSIDNQNLLLETDNDNNIIEVENYINETDNTFNFDIDDTQKQFICDICLKPFAKLKLLVIHLRYHTGEFICEKCLKIFCRKESLTSHLCNNTTKQFLCKICDKSFSQKKYLTRHTTVHHNKKFNCFNCKQVFYSNHELQNHNCNTSEELRDEKFSCKICAKNFSRTAYLKKHVRRTHSSKDQRSKPRICDICGVVLKTRNSYFYHRKIHKESQYNCSACDKSFKRREELNAHLKTHDVAEMPLIECKICGKKLKSQRSYKAHLQTHDDASNRYSCEMCASTFTFIGSLRKHKQNKHGVKPAMVNEVYNCPFCGKSVKLKGSIIRHLRKIHADRISNIDWNDIKPISVQYDDDVIINTEKIKPKDKCDKIVIKSNIIIREANVPKAMEEAVHLDTKKGDDKLKEVCLSIPDLTEADQEITLGKNAYILENGTIVQPEANSDKVVIYVLDQSFTC